MRIYTVHAPPAGRRDPDDPTRFAFIKEGFCWPALVIPVLWLIFRRLWLVLILFLAASAVLGALSDRVADPVAGVVFLAAVFLFALEANGLCRWTLERRGWRLVGVAEGRSLREAELRFFPAYVAAGGRIPGPAVAPPPPAAPAPPTGKAPEPAPVVGLFPTPGGAT
jgi:hypothetical protein